MPSTHLAFLRHLNRPAEQAGSTSPTTHRPARTSAMQAETSRAEVAELFTHALLAQRRALALAAERARLAARNAHD